MIKPTLFIIFCLMLIVSCKQNENQPIQNKPVEKSNPYKRVKFYTVKDSKTNQVYKIRLTINEAIFYCHLDLIDPKNEEVADSFTYNPAIRVLSGFEISKNSKFINVTIHSYSGSIMVNYYQMLSVVNGKFNFSLSLGDEYQDGYTTYTLDWNFTKYPEKLILEEVYEEDSPENQESWTHTTQIDFDSTYYVYCNKTLKENIDFNGETIQGPFPMIVTKYYTKLYWNNSWYNYEMENNSVKLHLDWVTDKSYVYE